MSSIRALSILAPASALFLVLITACNQSRDTRGSGPGAVDSETGGDCIDPTACAGDSSASEGAGDDGAEDAASDNDGGVVFDVGPGESGTAGDGIDDGCHKVDFLFVIDNSVSMQPYQERMVQQFPELIAAVRDDIGVEDYHVMVVDSDWGGNVGCTGQECIDYVFDNRVEHPDRTSCHELMVETPCGAEPGLLDQRLECDYTLGAGVTFPIGNDASNRRCEFLSGARWFDAAEPDPGAAFACQATVGTGGAQAELTVEAAAAAITPEQLAAGGCNEGFLRDDAILVVAFVADEGRWLSQHALDTQYGPLRDAIVAAKGGNADAVVAFGILDDSFLARTDPAAPRVCSRGLDTIGDGVKNFIERFPNNTWGSLCQEDWRELFVEALSIIDLTCERFVPPG